MDRNDPIRVAAVQLTSGNRIEANLLVTERLIAEAAQAGSSLVVLPENFACMATQRDELLALAEADGDGPIQAFLARQARRHGIWLVGGTIPLRSEDAGRYRAACLVFDAEGNRVARYDKVHMFDVELDNGEHYDESSWCEPGTDPVVVDTPAGRMGLAICYDLRFPELFRQLLDQGAELLALPAAFTATTGEAHWKVLIRARAIENQCHVIAAGQGGYHVNGRETWGESMIVDPWGNILQALGRGTGVVSAEISRKRLDEIRHRFPAIRHRCL